MKSTGSRRNLLLGAGAALLLILPLAASAQKHATPAQAPPATPKVPFADLPKVWHSEETKHDFRVEVTKDLFRAVWVNVPPTAAKRGAYIRTECRRAGSKWVGSSSIAMLFAVPGAPAGKDTKLCSINVRFEVDSVSPEQITGHSETLHGFDINSCRVQQTGWGAFTWIPKK